MSQYRFIDTHRADAPLKMLLKVLQVPSSSYHRWDSVGRACQEQRDLRQGQLVGEIRRVWQELDCTYGAHKVRVQLGYERITATTRHVAELMADNGLAGISGREKTTTTTRRDRLTKPFPDLVNRLFQPAEPNVVWYGDITYLWVQNKFWYLASVIDGATKEVLGWSFADHMRTELVTDALRRAIIRRGGNVKGVKFHSDRGAQYTSTEFGLFCENNNVTQSMGRTGVCWDNAAAESFWSTLKRELTNRYTFTTAKQLRRGLFQWIETWYNRRRLHASLGYRTPAQAYQQHLNQTAA